MATLRPKHQKRHAAIRATPSHRPLLAFCTGRYHLRQPPLLTKSPVLDGSIMKLGLINSAWVQANQPTVFGLRKTKEIGFDSIDLFIDPLEADVKKRKLVKDECDRLDLPIVSVCCVGSA